MTIIKNLKLFDVVLLIRLPRNLNLSAPTGDFSFFKLSFGAQPRRIHRAPFPPKRISKKANELGLSKKQRGQGGWGLGGVWMGVGGWVRRHRLNVLLFKREQLTDLEF